MRSVKKQKVVWVFAGGGNVCSYSCGSCKAISELKLPKPEIIVCGSGGAANAMFYSANQINEAFHIWGNEISSKKILFGLRFWRIFNIDLMVDGVFMGRKNPLSLKAVRKSKIKLHIGVTNYDDGKVEFFENKEKINLLSLLKATMTVPIFSGIFIDRSIKIRKTRYLDTRLSSRYEKLVEKALSFNPDKVIVFGNLPVGSKKYRYFGNFFYKFWLFTRTVGRLNFSFTKNQLKGIAEQEKMSLKDERIFYLAPKKRLDIAPWDNSKKELQRCLDKGYLDTLNRKKELQSFFGFNK